MDSQLYSPINGDSKDIGYITIFIGDNEAFYPQNMEYSKKLKNEGIPHNLYIGREMFHIYPLFNMPESNEELKKINDMINN
ncbi:hypothetical protein FACS189459_4720 [Bacilli bacterium]|nr:hypothetical protein FACS189459_4720 [Bacilli bacterium]